MFSSTSLAFFVFSIVFGLYSGFWKRKFGECCGVAKVSPFLYVQHELKGSESVGVCRPTERYVPKVIISYVSKRDIYVLTHGMPCIKAFISLIDEYTGFNVVFGSYGGFKREAWRTLWSRVSPFLYMQHELKGLGVAGAKSLTIRYISKGIFYVITHGTPCINP